MPSTYRLEYDFCVSCFRITELPIARQEHGFRPLLLSSEEFAFSGYEHMVDRLRDLHEQHPEAMVIKTSIHEEDEQEYNIPQFIQELDELITLPKANVPRHEMPRTDRLKGFDVRHI